VITTIVLCIGAYSIGALTIIVPFASEVSLHVSARAEDLMYYTFWTFSLLTCLSALYFFAFFFEKVFIG